MVELENDVAIEKGVERLPGLEEEFGREGAVIALVLYLTKDASPYVSMNDIVNSLNSDGLPGVEEAIGILTKAKFKRVSLKAMNFSNRIVAVENPEGDYWMRPEEMENITNWTFTDKTGISKVVESWRIYAIVGEHLITHGRMDLDLGDVSEFVDMDLNDPSLGGYAVVEPDEGDDSDDWN